MNIDVTKKFITTPDKNRTLSSLNLDNGDYNLYMIEKSFGLIHKMRQHICDDGIIEYVYTGRFHKGEIAFAAGKNLEIEIPKKDNFNYGYTLEGDANTIFKAKDALDSYNKFENRTFCYINASSVLCYVDDPFKTYSIYVKVYENCYGFSNCRWVVIYACKPSDEELERMKNKEY